MVSVQSLIIREHWARMAELASSKDTPEDVRTRVEQWADLTAEPSEVHYIETEVAGQPALWAVPKNGVDDRVVLAIHGGGFISGSIQTHRKLVGHLAKAVGVRALIPEYRRTPEHAYPAQLDDVTAAYRWLLDQGINGAHVALAADSSGAGPAIAMMLRARDQRLPLAAAVMLMSPWVDMAVTSDTYESNRAKEPFFQKEVVAMLAGMYLRDTDAKDPLASPLYADLSGLPPMYIQVGGDETLLGDACRLAENATTAGVDVRIDVYPSQLHTFQMGAGRVPESDVALRRFAGWVRPRLGLA